MKLLEKHFDTAFAAPDGIKKLRELILTLAMQGKLVEQDPSDQPASELLKEIEVEKLRLVEEKKIKKQKPLPEIKAGDVPSGLPDGWEWVRLGDLGIAQTGTTPSSKDPLNYGEHIPFIGPGDIVNGKLDCSNKGLSERGLSKGRLIEKQSVLMVCIGGSIGKHVINDQDITCNQQINTITPYQHISYRYLYRAMATKYFQHFVINMAGGSATPIINKQKWTSILVPLPPFAEQHRIVTKIDQLMTRCDELEELRAEQEQKRLAIHTSALKKLLDAQEQNTFANAWKFLTTNFGELYTVKENVAELRKAILQLAVMGKLVEQDPSDQPASELLKEIEVEKLRLVEEKKIKKQKPLPEIKAGDVPSGLPDGWEWVRLGEIGLINPRNDAEDSKMAGFVSMPLIPEGYSENHQFEERHWSDIKKGYTHFAEGDVGMAKITPCFENAKSCVFSGLPNGIGAGTTELHIFRNSFNSIVPRFLLYYLKNPHYISKAVPRMTGSAGQKRVPTPYFKEQLFPLPPLAEQHRIVNKVDQLMTLCDNLENQIDTATNTQNNLLGAVMAQV